MAVINASAGDYIGFSEGDQAVAIPSTVLETLVFTEAAVTSNRQGFVTETLLLSDIPHYPILDAETLDTLVFTEQHARGPHASAFDGIGFVDFAGMFHGGNQTDTLNILETIAGQITKPGVDTLSLTETAASRLRPFLALSETLTFIEAALGTRVNCSAVDIRNEIVLYSGDTTLTLCRPTTGDVRRRDLQRINRRSRGNDLIIYRDPNWVRSDHVTYRLDVLTEGQKYNLLNFLEFTTGQVVTMRDYENNLWQGFIMNPSTAVVQTGPCSYACELQFSGGIIQNGE